MANESKRMEDLEKMVLDQGMQLTEMATQIQELRSQLAARPSSSSTPDGDADYLMANGWQPIGPDSDGHDMWKPPPHETKIWEKEVVVPCAKKDADPNLTTKFKRTMIPSLELDCTTLQAVFKQRQKDKKQVA